MDKAPDAYRTISEVGEELDIPQHVLRFWETRFAQIKPLKRGGGRRYYRPDDVELLKGIRHLLYKEGYTIKGVQRILKENGVRAVQVFANAEGVVGAPVPEDWSPTPSLEAIQDPVLHAPERIEPVFQPIRPVTPVSAPVRQPEPSFDQLDADDFPASGSMMPTPTLHPAPHFDEPPAPTHILPSGQVSMFRGGLSRKAEAERDLFLPGMIEDEPTIAVPPRPAPVTSHLTKPAKAHISAINTPVEITDEKRAALEQAYAVLAECRARIDRVLARKSA